MGCNSECGLVDVAADHHRILAIAPFASTWLKQANPPLLVGFWLCFSMTGLVMSEPALKSNGKLDCESSSHCILILLALPPWLSMNTQKGCR